MAEFVERSGNIFGSACSAIVITVNCQGVMGAGIALEARLRWPSVFEVYQRECANGSVQIGRVLYIPKTVASQSRDVICFPTKQHWRHPSRLRYVAEGLESLCQTIATRSIKSLALPHLGCDNGGLEWSVVGPIVTRSLSSIPELTVETWAFQEDLDDPDFAKLVKLVRTRDAAHIGESLGLTLRQSRALVDAISTGSARGFASLQSSPGIGEKTLQATYAFLFHSQVSTYQEPLPFG